MRKDLALIATIASGLLIGSVAGVAAQEAERAASVEVTGTHVEGPCPGGPSPIVGMVERSRGWVCINEWSMSDPRLDGTFTRAWNLDFHWDGTNLVIGYATGRLETEDGAWQQRPGLRAGFEGDFGENVELLIFDGEEAFGGLVAVVWLVSREDGVRLNPARLEGFIVDSEFPPSDFLAE